MKMNVKGLVFVGFAAAVFAGAAQAAGDKIVTSKTYVDAKISDAATISSSSTSTAPNEKAVYDALALKANDSAVIKGVNDPEGTPLTATNGVVTLPAAQAVNDGTLTITVDGTAKTFKANQATNESVTVTVPVKSVTVGGTEVTPSGTGAVALGSAAGANLATNGVASGETGLVTGGEVNTAIADALEDVAGDYQIKSGAAYNLGNASGGWTALTADEQAAIGSGITSTKVSAYDTHVADTDIHVTTTDKTTWNAKVGSVTTGTSGTGTITVDNQQVQVYGLGTAAGADTTTTIASGGTGLPTAGTVYTAIEDAKAAVLPANGTGDAACTTDNPCALVYDGTTTEWKRIQQ